MAKITILTCKLYKASPRKDKIKAALVNPINVKLVTQLRKYLDDDYQMLDQEKPADVQDSDVTDEVVDDIEIDEVSDDTSGGGSSGGSAPSSGGDIQETDIDEESDIDEEVEPIDEPEVDSSIKTEQMPIKASTVIDTSGLHDELKGTLNLRTETAGVERVNVNETETWVYYRDKINLNTIMSPVIELVNITYPYLAFSRLARSDNAIVFDINNTNTDNKVEPIEIDEKDKK